MKLTKPQREVIDCLVQGRTMTYREYNSFSAAATWDDEPWTPYQKNWSVVIRSLLKKRVVVLIPDKKTFHVFSVELIEGREEHDSP